MNTLHFQKIDFSNKPSPISLWGKWLCRLGIHRKQFIFGWECDLENTTEGYAGTFYCNDCSAILKISAAK
jgi:hypothetical protein